MYAADDDYTATTGMKSYYFRGAVNNNWVQFGKEGDKDIYWRIIRINGDGSIRMIYSGTTDPSTVSSVTKSNGVYMTETETQINLKGYKFNSISNSPSYVGYMYTEGEQRGNGTTSTVKTVLENWYAGTTLKDNGLVSKDQIFCNDRSATTSEGGTPGELSEDMSASKNYYYGAYVRLNINKTPKLSCTTSIDKFTINTSNGNGTLTYPVGLITADEVAMAGGVVSKDNMNYYLYTRQVYWVGSPYYFRTTNTDTRVFSISKIGTLSHYFVSDELGVRPVISLSPSVKLSGNGTYDDVYTVS